MQQQVEEKCEQWLELASRGDVERMLDLMTTAGQTMLKPSEDVGDPGSFFSSMLKSALMRQSPIVSELTQLRSPGELQLQVKDAEIYATGKPVTAIMYYSVRSATASGEELSIVIGFQRLRAAGSRQVWLIDSWRID